MEEWINAVTLSLNAEMEKEKALREEAQAALSTACEGEDLDAIEAAIEEAVAKGVAEEALAKARSAELAAVDNFEVGRYGVGKARRTAAAAPDVLGT